MTNREHVLCSDEESTKFILSYRGHDELDNLSNGEDRTVEAREGIIIREKYVGASSTASFGFFVGSRIRVSGKNRATGTVGDDVSGVGFNIIKGLISCGVGELGGRRLLSDEGSEANK